MSRLRENTFVWLLLLRRLLVGWVVGYVAVCVLFGATAQARLALICVTALWCAAVGGLYLSRHLRANARCTGLWHGLELAATNVALALFLAEVTLRAALPLFEPTLLVSD